MRLGRLYGWAMTVAGGAIVFQTTASCSTEALNTVATSLMPALTSALTTAVGGSTCDTTSSGSITPATGGVFNDLTDTINGIRSNLGNPPQLGTTTD